VNRIVIFLNELSCFSDAAITREEMAPHVLNTLRAISEARKIRRDIIVIGSQRLASIPLGDGTLSLAAVLNAGAYRDELRFVMSLDQLSPWDAYPKVTKPEENTEEISCNGRPGVGMLWAKQNHSAVYSFAFPPRWADSYVQAQLHKLNPEGTELSSSDVNIPNMSRPEHVGSHHDLISNYGMNLATSTIVYQGIGFIVRMYFNDHPPPHFHVLERRNTSVTLAKLTIGSLDTLEGELPPSLRRRVKDWASARTADLMNNWERCMRHEHPFLIPEG
jgi:hypothetical protein